MSPEWKPALSWRITAADPRGMMMWFDPLTEEPAVRSTLPPYSEEGLPHVEGRDEGGTYTEGRGVPCEGSAAEPTDRDQSDLPF